MSNNNQLFEASLFDELCPIYPDTDPCGGSECYNVAVAANTYAGVHIMLSGLTVGKFVTMQATGPIKKTVTAAQADSHTTVEVSLPDHRFKFFELLALPVEVNTGGKTRTEWTTGDTNANVIRRAPFMVYDVLKPCTNVLRANGEVMALAFRCKTENYSGKPEVQKWELNISHDGITRHMTFLVEVFPVAVPDASKDDHKYVNWISPKSISDCHNVELLSPDWFTLFEKYLRLAKYGRQNMASIDDVVCFDHEKGKTPCLNEERLDKVIAILDKLDIYWIEGPHLAGRRDNEWEATEAETIFSHKIIPGDGEAELANMAGQLFAYIKKHKLEARWIQSIMDEPTDCLAKTFHLEADIVKKAMPGIHFLEATIATDTITDTVHYWCPTVDEYENNRDFFDGRVKKGDELFVYTCLNPAGNYCNRLLDQERLRPVYIGWAPAIYENVIGFLHWGGIYLSHTDPYYLSAPLPEITDYTSDRKGSLPAGDPYIMFPGVFEAYSSTRLEAHRIGLEDLHLLNALKKTEPQAVKELVACVFARYDEYEKDISVYRKTRRRLLAACAKITPAK